MGFIGITNPAPPPPSLEHSKLPRLTRKRAKAERREGAVPLTLDGRQGAVAHEGRAEGAAQGPWVEAE